tara:strand:+ start:3293 stop:3505 length:213 start_codon:yes stop_codon:yes gene_type:complete
MEEVLISKIITLEVIVDTLLEELFENDVIDKHKFDKVVLAKIKKLQNQLKKIEIDNIDYSNLFNGPIGEA